MWFIAISRVASGSGGIISSSGSYHAICDEGAYTWFDGVHVVWEGTWKAEIDVYLNPNWIPGQGFQYSVASYNIYGGHLRDYVFHVYLDESTGRLFVGGSNNTNNPPRTDLENIGTEVKTAGWFTLQHVFSDVGGLLSVDMNLIDCNDNVVLIETLSYNSDLIASIVGGNGYGWFSYINLDSGIAVDESKLLRCPN